MAFVLKQTATYRWPVKILLPGEGKRVTHQFEATFKRLGTSRIEEIIKIARAVGSGELSEEDFELAELLMEIIADWSDVEEAPGKPLPFSKDAVVMLLEIPTAGPQILETWFNSINHQKQKN